MLNKSRVFFIHPPTPHTTTTPAYHIHAVVHFSPITTLTAILNDQSAVIKLVLGNGSHNVEWSNNNKYYTPWLLPLFPKKGRDLWSVKMREKCIQCMVTFIYLLLPTPWVSFFLLLFSLGDQQHWGSFLFEQWGRRAPDPPSNNNNITTITAHQNPPTKSFIFSH